LNGLGCLALHHPQAAARIRKEEIDFKPLLIAKMVELFPAPASCLALEDLGRDKPFEQRSEEWRAIQLGLGGDSQKITGEAGIAQVHFW